MFFQNHRQNITLLSEKHDVLYNVLGLRNSINFLTNHRIGKHCIMKKSEHRPALQPEEGEDQEEEGEGLGGSAEKLCFAFVPSLPALVCSHCHPTISSRAGPRVANKQASKRPPCNSREYKSWTTALLRKSHHRARLDSNEMPDTRSLLSPHCKGFLALLRLVGAMLAI